MSGTRQMRAWVVDRPGPVTGQPLELVQRAVPEPGPGQEPVNKVIVGLSDRYKVGFPYTIGQADFSTTQQRKLGIVGNGPDRTLGNFDMARIQRVMSIVVPIFMGRNNP
jgi:hypothetical protein